MTYDFDVKIQTILDKKFKPKIHAGYDPIDVDSFFDEIIEYLKEVRKLVNEKKNSKSEIWKEINDLRKRNADLEKTILIKDKHIQELEHEGYTNSAILRRLDKKEEK